MSGLRAERSPRGGVADSVRLWKGLATEFRPTEIKQKQGQDHIDARTAMNRLDEVVGPANWRDSYVVERFQDGSEAVVCTIEINIEGEWVGKSDAGGFRQMSGGKGSVDQNNTAKTGFSHAFKRAAVKWGVGRHLYKRGVPRLYGLHLLADAKPTPPPPPPGPEPEEPDPADPHYADAPQESSRESAPASSGEPDLDFGDRLPSTPKAFYAWMKNLEERYQVSGLTNRVANWGKNPRVGYGSNVMEWTPEQIQKGVAKVIDGFREGKYGPRSRPQAAPEAAANFREAPAATEPAAGATPTPPWEGGDGPCLRGEVSDLGVPTGGFAERVAEAFEATLVHVELDDTAPDLNRARALARDAVYDLVCARAGRPVKGKDFGPAMREAMASLAPPAGKRYPSTIQLCEDMDLLIHLAATAREALAASGDAEALYAPEPAGPAQSTLFGAYSS